MKLQKRLLCCFYKHSQIKMLTCSGLCWGRMIFTHTDLFYARVCHKCLNSTPAKLTGPSLQSNIDCNNSGWSCNSQYFFTTGVILHNSSSLPFHKSWPFQLPCLDYYSIKGHTAFQITSCLYSQKSGLISAIICYSNEQRNSCLVVYGEAIVSGKLLRSLSLSSGAVQYSENICEHSPPAFSSY